MLAAAAIAWSLADTAGVRHTESELRQAPATVFLFLSPGCPLSNAYAPEIRRLHGEFHVRGVRFLSVNRGEALAFPDLVDPGHTLARRLGATVTPEAVVLGRDGTRLYRGRIDDRVLALGRPRAAATRADLREALEEIVSGRPVSRPDLRATGCAIPFPRPAGKPGPSYGRDVAPILWRHCVDCHRPGQSGPFPLLTYADAAVRAATIAQVTARRVMPPWLAEPNPEHPFAGERRLSAREIRLLRDWAEAGAPEGPPPRTSPPPEPPEWRLGQPDLVVNMPQSFSIPADGPDLYQCVVVPLPLREPRHVRAYEFHPGARASTHHALLLLDSSGAARRRDAETPGYGYPCFGVPGFLPSASLGGWTPGFTPSNYPPGAAVTIRPGMDLVMQLHYHPTGVPHSDRSSVGLYFQETAPTRRMMDVALGSRAIDIPPGERRYRVTDSFTLPVDVEVTGIIPHAHYLARRMRGRAVLPGGRTTTLIDIREWDFNWQTHFRYQQPFRLPADTRIEMEFVYDNSESNPRNPSRPPKRVVWGPESTDEMAGLHAQVIPYSKEDAEELGRFLWGKMMREISNPGAPRRPD